MRRNKYRKLRRTLRVEPRRGVRRARPLSRSTANVSPDTQRYSYQISLRRLALKMRATSKRLHSVETQLARSYKTLSGTKAEMSSATNVGGGLMWSAMDEDVLYVHDDTGWQLSKATQSGTTVERLVYTPIFTGEMWWDTTLEQLFVWNGLVWDDVSVVHSGTTAERYKSGLKDAYLQDVGDLWWDTTSGEWYMDVGKGWQVVNPDIQDTFDRVPSLMSLYGGKVTQYYRYYGITPYNWWIYWGKQLYSWYGVALTLFMWVRPQQAVNDAPVVSQWYPNPPDYTYSYSIEQNDDVFSFGVSDDGTRGNRVYVETDPITDITSGWHFVVGLFEPSNCVKLFHNGVWYRNFVGTPSHIHFDDDLLYNYMRINQRFTDPSSSLVDWAYCGVSTAPASERLIENMYDRTKGFFL